MIRSINEIALKKAIPHIWIISVTPPKEERIKKKLLQMIQVSRALPCTVMIPLQKIVYLLPAKARY
jgi:hypothetical protein